MISSTQVKIRPLLIHRLWLGGLTLAFSSYGLYVGVQEGSTLKIAMGGFFIVTAILALANFTWWHYTVFSHDVIIQHHWLGLFSIKIPTDTVVSITRSSELAEAIPVPGVKFAWLGGAIDINLVAYGEAWLGPVLQALNREGIAVDQSLIDEFNLAPT